MDDRDISFKVLTVLSPIENKNICYQHTTNYLDFKVTSLSLYFLEKLTWKYG